MILRIALCLLALATPLRAEIAIQEVTSPGGIKAWLVEDHNIPFMALDISFRGGTSLDQPGKRGAEPLRLRGGQAVQRLRDHAERDTARVGRQRLQARQWRDDGLQFDGRRRGR